MPPPNSDRKSTRLNSSHSQISYAVFCLKKKKAQHDSPGFGPVRGPEDDDPVGFEGGRGPRDAGVVGRRPKAAADGPVEAGVELGGQMRLPSRFWARYTCLCKYITGYWLLRQVVSITDLPALVERLTTDALPAGRTLGAWRALLQAHATLMRRLETDLEKETGLALA